jgi:hypothetical protein
MASSDSCQSRPTRHLGRWVGRSPRCGYAPLSKQMSKLVDRSCSRHLRMGDLSVKDGGQVCRAAALWCALNRTASRASISSHTCEASISRSCSAGAPTDCPKATRAVVSLGATPCGKPLFDNSSCCTLKPDRLVDCRTGTRSESQRASMNLGHDCFRSAPSRLERRRALTMANRGKRNQSRGTRARHRSSSRASRL